MKDPLTAPPPYGSRKTVYCLLPLYMPIFTSKCFPLAADAEAKEFGLLNFARVGEKIFYIR